MRKTVSKLVSARIKTRGGGRGGGGKEVLINAGLTVFPRCAREYMECMEGTISFDSS